MALAQGWRTQITNREVQTQKKCLHFSICACHPCAGAMLIFSVSFQFLRMTPKGSKVKSIEKTIYNLVDKLFFTTGKNRLKRTSKFIYDFFCFVIWRYTTLKIFSTFSDVHIFKNVTTCFPDHTKLEKNISNFFSYDTQFFKWLFLEFFDFDVSKKFKEVI